MSDISVRREVLVRMPTRGRRWRLGDLRNMLEEPAVADLGDDYVVVINEGNQGYSMRFLEPSEADMPPLTDAERIAAVENVVNSHPEWTLETVIEAMDFSVKTYNLLKREHIDTIADLVIKSRNDLFDCRNFGQRSVEECEQKLALGGFKLRPNDLS